MTHIISSGSGDFHPPDFKPSKDEEILHWRPPRLNVKFPKLLPSSPKSPICISLTFTVGREPIGCMTQVLVNTIFKLSRLHFANFANCCVP